MDWMREPNVEPIPGYRLIEPLGRGGFGEVWKCEAPGGLYKAIKFVYGSINAADNDGIRAEQELKALKRIKEVRHPFICSLERFEFIEGELVVVMELADRTMHDVFEDHRNAGLVGIPRESLLRYIGDTAEGLDYIIEKHNLVHLDVKPRNLLVVSDRVKVADYGLVKDLSSNSSGSFGGVTPLYASPEVFVGKASAQSDQYSLAIVYQEMLTGQRPFTAKNVRQLAQMHLTAEPDLRSLSEADRPIVARALAKDPAKRFPTCAAFVKALVKVRSYSTDGRSCGRGGSSDDGMDGTLPPSRSPLPHQGTNGDGHAANGSSGSIRVRSSSNSDEVRVAAEGGVTLVEPEFGAFRPTLIIGLGGFGKKAIIELRCRMLDRFGDLRKTPSLSFLYIDSDTEAVEHAQAGSPELALGPHEVYPLPLQPVSNYRRRSIEQISEWLPREKLYNMPRSLTPTGSRALGRLAFADNQQKLFARLRREISEITDPDSIFQTVTNSGLALLSKSPRIFVLGAAGGSMSGMLADLGYLLRRTLGQLRHPDAHVQTVLLCGAPNDPVTPKVELANTYATLTELNHFSDPATSFNAQYSVDGQRIVDEGSPYNHVYVTTLKHRSPDFLAEGVSHLGNFLFHEITTPLGRRLDQVRDCEDIDVDSTRLNGMPVALRSFGTYAVWFPRGLMLNLAARIACRQLIEGWLTENSEGLPEGAERALEDLVAKTAGRTDLSSDAIAALIESRTQVGTPTDTGDSPRQVIAGVLAKMEGQIYQQSARETPGAWSKMAYARVNELLGERADSSDSELNEWRKTKVARGLLASAQKLAEEVDREIAKEAYSLLEFDGPRVHLTARAFEQLHDVFMDASERQLRNAQAASQTTARSGKAVDDSLDECSQPVGGFLFFGKSRPKQIQRFIERLSKYAMDRLQEETQAAVRHFYSTLAHKLHVRMRDLDFCKQRLRFLQESLEQQPPDEEAEEDTSTGSYTVGRTPVAGMQHLWEVVRQSSTARVILPEGQDDLEQAAIQFLRRLGPENWARLDHELSENVWALNGGFADCCVSSGDKARRMAPSLIAEAHRFLDIHLPVMDVAQILSEEMKQSQNLADEAIKNQVNEHFELAEPAVRRRKGGKQYRFLLTPGSAAGKQLSAAVERLYPDVQVVTVPGQTDLMFLREQGGVGLSDIAGILRACEQAYESATVSPASSPHSRFDITDWMPLDP